MSFEYSCFKEDIYIYYGMPDDPIQKALLGITYEDSSYEIIRNDNNGIYSIEYVYSGECVIQHNKEIFTAKAGDFFILHPYNYHHYYSNPKNPCKKIFICIEVGNKLVRHLVNDYNLTNITHLPGFNNPTSWEQCFDAFKNNRRDSSKLFYMTIHSILFDAASKIANTVNNDVSSLKLLKDYLERNITHRVTIEDCCQIAGMNKARLYSSFRQVFGMTPLTYIIQLKIDAAKTILEKTNISISEIADTFDFYDQYHFSKTFKKHTGISPNEYRRLNSRI